MPPAGLIVEGIVTSTNADGSTNIAPMGPIVVDDFAQLILRPYRTSTTYANLKRTGHGVFHVTDNVLLLAQAAIDRLDPPPELISCPASTTAMLADACRWYAFEQTHLDDAAPRTMLTARVVAAGTNRDFLGFNRAKHAVVEAAILATRVGILPPQDILAQCATLATWVDKTGGPPEHQAFALLREYIDAQLHTSHGA